MVLPDVLSVVWPDVRPDNGIVLLLPTLAEILGGNNADTAKPRAGPSLTRFFRHARQYRSGTNCLEQAFLQSLGVSVPGFAELPAARASYLYDFNESAPTDCARADPVSIRTSMEQAQLVPSAAIGLTQNESDAVIESLNAHFSVDGLQFLAGNTNRWYVTGVSARGLDAAPVHSAGGRNISTFLPTDDTGRHWRKLATEVQMLLHQHPVNAQRQLDNRLPLNALWFWGAGTLCENVVRQIEARGMRPVFTDSDFVMGMCELTGQKYEPLGNSLPCLDNLRVDRRICQHGCLVATTRLLDGLLEGNVSELQGAVDRIDHLLSRLHAQLLRGQIPMISVDTCDGWTYRLTRWDLLRFWRSGKCHDPESSELT